MRPPTNSLISRDINEYAWKDKNELRGSMEDMVSEMEMFGRNFQILHLQVILDWYTLSIRSEKNVQ